MMPAIHTVFKRSVHVYCFQEYLSSVEHTLQDFDVFSVSPVNFKSLEMIRNRHAPPCQQVARFHRRCALRSVMLILVGLVASRSQAGSWQPQWKWFMSVGKLVSGKNNKASVV